MNFIVFKVPKLKKVGASVKNSQLQYMMYTLTRPHHTLASPYITHINMCTFSGSGSRLVEDTTGNIHKQTTTRCLRAERRPTQTELSVLPLCFCRAMTRQSSINLPAPHIGNKKHYQWIPECSNQFSLYQGRPSTSNHMGFRGAVHLISIWKRAACNRLCQSNTFPACKM